MSWFKSKVLVKVETEKKITEHQKAAKKVVEKAQTANTKLANLIEENGFTLNIALALGAEHRSKHRKRTA